MVVPAPLTTKPPERVRLEEVLVCVMAVTFEPTLALITLDPVPVPALMMAPALFTPPVERVIPWLVVLLFLRIRLPVPVTPPVRDKFLVPAALTSVVPALLTVSAVVLI